MVVTMTERDTLAEAALREQLRALMAAGPVRSERALAGRLGVSRHGLRRLLGELRDAGELPPASPSRRGTAWRDEELARATNPLEIIELRQIVEPAFARFAALRASPLELARIERAAHTPSGSDAAVADLAFHTAVALAARNGLGAALHALLRQVATDARLRTGGAPCADRLRRRDAEHQAVAAAITLRDADAAERAMAAHLAAVHRRILGRLAPSADAA